MCNYFYTEFFYSIAIQCFRHGEDLLFLLFGYSTFIAKVNQVSVHPLIYQSLWKVGKVFHIFYLISW